MHKKSMLEREKRAKCQQKQDALLNRAKERHEAHLQLLTKWAEENKVRCDLLIDEIHAKAKEGKITRDEVIRTLAIDAWFQYEIAKGLKTCGKLRLAGNLRRVLPGDVRKRLISLIAMPEDPVALKVLEKEFIRQREEIGRTVKAI